MLPTLSLLEAKTTLALWRLGFDRDSRLELCIPNFDRKKIAVECVSALLAMHPSRMSSGYVFVSKIS